MTTIFVLSDYRYSAITGAPCIRCGEVLSGQHGQGVVGPYPPDIILHSALIRVEVERWSHGHVICDPCLDAIKMEKLL